MALYFINLQNKYFVGGVATFLGLSYFGFRELRRYFAGGVCRSNNRLDGQLVLVTGANCGIGFETALECVRRGARVLLACRDEKRGQQAVDDICKATGANESQVFMAHLDLSSLESVRNFSKCFHEREQSLNILVNNAGIMACPEWRSADGYEMQFAVNHLGHFLLTCLLMDRLEAAPSARIVNVSSLAHESGKIHWENINLEAEYHSWVAYSQSKLANVLFTKELARRCRLLGNKVTSCSLHPGVIETELARHMKNKSSTFDFKFFIFNLFKPIIIKTRWQGAQTTLHCILADDLVDGAYYSDCAVKKPSALARDDTAARRLWRLSAEMVNLVKKETTAGMLGE